MPAYTQPMSNLHIHNSNDKFPWHGLGLCVGERCYMPLLKAVMGMEQQTTLPPCRRGDMSHRTMSCLLWLFKPSATRKRPSTDRSKQFTPPRCPAE